MNGAKLALCLLIAGWLARPAQARIGETLEECVTRYGNPVKTLPPNQVVFQKEGFGILVSFYEKKVDAIYFRKVETDALGHGSKLSENEVQLLLKANGGGKAWKEISTDPMKQHWITEDHAMEASYDPLDPFLYIYTKEAAERASAKQSEAEKRKLQGF